MGLRSRQRWRPQRLRRRAQMLHMPQQLSYAAAVAKAPLHQSHACPLWCAPMRAHLCGSLIELLYWQRPECSRMANLAINSNRVNWLWMEQKVSLKPILLLNGASQARASQVSSKAQRLREQNSMLNNATINCGGVFHWVVSTRICI